MGRRVYHDEIAAQVLPGAPWPLGAHACCDGTNFAVFSRHATEMELSVFDTPNAQRPSLRVPVHHRTGDIWHVRIASDLRRRWYVFRAVGGWGLHTTARSNQQQLLLDPYARCIAFTAVHPMSTGEPSPEDQRPCRAVGLVIEDRFDWQAVAPPRRPWADTIIYETHVRGLTKHGSSSVYHPGQYLGLVEKIPYLQQLGITAVELLPIQAFARESVPGRALGLTQYWGYNPIALFAPHPSYASSAISDAAVAELKTMVRELHRAGIEVILDVVFNHTGESGEAGPVYSFRGLDNEIYYMLSADGHYVDFTGCGNTLNCNHPVVRSLILDCLRYWVVEYHIDGFRFDLAAVLGRGSDGAILSNPPLLDAIAEDPILRNVKLIAEAWDAAGAFQVGRFSGERWAEWNCCFRDDVRRFWRGDPEFSGRFASRICGSADLYQRGNSGTPLKSLNFVTSHDGFTLSDLVSYAAKHNEANGEDNRDGAHENFSADYGVSGPTEDVHILSLRRRQVKNLLTSLLLARGVPMLLGGDEFGRTQSGNNNAYCQDNEISWYDWRLLDEHADLFRFVCRVIQLRKDHSVFRAERFYSESEVIWLGPQSRDPAWHGPLNQVGCMVLDGSERLALLFNAAAETCEFLLPPPEDPWKILIDTASESPGDAPDSAYARVHGGSSPIRLDAFSTLVLSTRRTG